MLDRDGIFAAGLAFLLHASSALATDRHDHCRLLELIDADTGNAIVGIEDLAIDPKGDAIYLSAYDRWRLEAALDDPAASLPSGGIYRLDQKMLGAADDPIVLKAMSAEFAKARDFHPHGIAVAAAPDGSASLFAINRRYHRTDEGKAARETVLEMFALEKGRAIHRRSFRSPDFCNANDVAVPDEGRIFLSLDRKACNGPALWLETVLGLERGRVIAIETDMAEEVHPVDIATGLGFANGLAIDPKTSSLLIAETRSHRITSHGLSQDQEVRLLRTLPLVGGPDNLTIDGEGRLLAAVHPSLFRFGLHRFRWFGERSAPSRIVAITPDLADVRVIHDDPDGQLLGGITVAARLDSHLVMGSATEAGVLVCSIDKARKAWGHVDPTSSREKERGH